MDIYFSVFNCHINDAKEKAIDMFKQVYSERKFEKQIQPFLDRGIMSIFNEDPNRYTRFFAGYIQRIVNQ